MKLCNAIHHFKEALFESQFEIEEIKFKTRESGMWFACSLMWEIDSSAIPVRLHKEANSVKFFGIKFTWPEK